MIPEELRQRYPWPEVPPGTEPFLITLGGNDRNLVERLLVKRSYRTVVEIGCFLGGSVLRWVTCSPLVSVVAVDPWDDDPWGDVLACRPPWYLGPKPPDSVVSQLNAPGGLMHTCLANLAPHRDRIVPVRARARDVLDELADLGLRPDLVYIDADKKREDLDVCHRLWPDAVLSGDDYLWAPDEGYPMQRVVKAFARDHGYRVMHKRQTWLLRRGPLAWLSHRLGDLGRARSAGA